MEAKVKIDKFGRVLIPKKIREIKGYRPGTELSLVMEPELGTITMTSVAEKEAKRPVLQLDEFGIPTFVFDTQEVFTYDFTDAIRNDRSERGMKNEEG
ncbi:MAG: AbrB/MazE/SpoVT family DNA-binding domain-containing protein [Lewinella sp.]